MLQVAKTVLLVILFYAPAQAQLLLPYPDPFFTQTPLDTIQQASVVIKTEGGHGTGVVQNVNGISRIWTVAHVIKGHEDERIFAMKETTTEDGESTIRRVSCKLIAADYDLDLAVLLPYNAFPDGVKFADERRVGTELWHVGAWLDTAFSGSLSSGILSKTYVPFPGNKSRDQTDLSVFPGSSGGGAFRKSDGACIGLLVTVMNADANFNHFVPFRHIKEWAAKNNIPVEE